MIRPDRPARSAGAAGLLLAAAVLAGCAVNQDLRLDVQGQGLPANAAVSLRTAPADSAAAAGFGDALAAAFASNGHSISGDAPVIAVFGFTQRAGSIGAADGTASPSADGKPATLWLSAPARKRALQACKAERLRATLALYSRTDKALIYRATGEVDGCSFTRRDVDALARALVAGAAR